MYDQAKIVKYESAMAIPSIDNFEVIDTASLGFSGTPAFWVASDALVSSIGFHQVRDAPTSLRALVLFSLENKTVRIGVMANMPAWSLSCRLLFPLNEATLVRGLVFGSVG